MISEPSKIVSESNETVLLEPENFLFELNGLVSKECKKDRNHDER